MWGNIYEISIEIWLHNDLIAIVDKLYGKIQFCYILLITRDIIKAIMFVWLGTVLMAEIKLYL